MLFDKFFKCELICGAHVVLLQNENNESLNFTYRFEEIVQFLVIHVHDFVSPVFRPCFTENSLEVAKLLAGHTPEDLECFFLFITLTGLTDSDLSEFTYSIQFKQWNRNLPDPMIFPTL